VLGNCQLADQFWGILILPYAILIIDSKQALLD
jgi:hypothetical protein